MKARHPATTPTNASNLVFTEPEEKQEPSNLVFTEPEEKQEPPSPNLSTKQTELCPRRDIIEPIALHIQKAFLSRDSLKIPFHHTGEATPTTRIDHTLDALDRQLLGNSSRMIGYQVNYDFNYDKLNSRFLQYHINNAGDPFTTSNLRVEAKPMEIAVLDFFANLWKISQDSYWGYVTSGGSEGNMHGLLLARERFPNGIVLTSRESHFSIFKALRFFRMDMQTIPTIANGEIDYELLEQAIASHPNRPIIISANIGTTVKSAVDDIDKIVAILDKLQVSRDRFHLHLDGALSGIMVPFIDGAPKIDFSSKPIDSMAVSGHKFLGCPFPCGVTITRKEHVEKVENYIDYLGTFDNTLMCSRSGLAPIYLWYALSTKGLGGLQADVDHCVDTARYLCKKLRAAGLKANVNPFSTTVCFERPVDQEFILRWQLSCTKDIAHVVAMRATTMGKLDVFVEEFLESIKLHGRVSCEGEDSPLATLDAEW